MLNVLPEDGQDEDESQEDEIVESSENEEEIDNEAEQFDTQLPTQHSVSLEMFC